MSISTSLIDGTRYSAQQDALHILRACAPCVFVRCFGRPLRGLLLLERTCAPIVLLDCFGRPLRGQGASPLYPRLCGQSPPRIEQVVSLLSGGANAQLRPRAAACTT